MRSCHTSKLCLDKNNHNWKRNVIRNNNVHHQHARHFHAPVSTVSRITYVNLYKNEVSILIVNYDVELLFIYVYKTGLPIQLGYRNQYSHLLLPLHILYMPDAPQATSK